MVLGAIKVDVMPTEDKILGFSNRWYGPGIRHKVPASLHDGTEIYLLSAPYFIGTKLEAFLDPRRGAREFRYSHDLEDVIAVLDARPSVKDEVAAAPPDIRVSPLGKLRLVEVDHEGTQGAVLGHKQADHRRIHAAREGISGRNFT